jgi:hypothetical protein
MIKTAFLICALALPLSNSTESELTARQFIREYNAFKACLQTCYPDYEFMIIPELVHEVPPRGWSYVPFHWRNTVVYMRVRRAA